MYIDRKKKPGLVKRMDVISLGLLMLFVFLLLVFIKYQQVADTYTDLHRRVKALEVLHEK